MKYGMTKKERDWAARSAFMDAREAVHARAEADTVEGIGDPEIEGPAWRMQQADAEDRVIATADVLLDAMARDFYVEAEVSAELESAQYRWGVIL